MSVYEFVGRGTGEFRVGELRAARYGRGWWGLKRNGRVTAKRYRVAHLGGAESTERPLRLLGEYCERCERQRIHRINVSAHRRIHGMLGLGGGLTRVYWACVEG
jgi:hypothetical protein